MTDRRIVVSHEYKEGSISAQINDCDAGKQYNPYIAGTTSWHRWNVGWNDYFLEAKGVME